MNKLDKLIAQENGIGLRLPPFHKYVIELEPKGNKHVEIIKENNKTFAEIKDLEISTSFFGRQKSESKNRVEIDMSYLTFKHNFYYDDPEETEDERLAIVEKLKLGSFMTGSLGGEYINMINGKIRLYNPKAEITLIKTIKKLDYTYKPLSELLSYEELKETSTDDLHNQTEKLPESITIPSKGFMDSIRHFITGNN